MEVEVLRAPLSQGPSGGLDVGQHEALCATPALAREPVRDVVEVVEAVAVVLHRSGMIVHEGEEALPSRAHAHPCACAALLLGQPGLLIGRSTRFPAVDHAKCRSTAVR